MEGRFSLVNYWQNVLFSYHGVINEMLIYDHLVSKYVKQISFFLITSWLRIRRVLSDSGSGLKISNPAPTTTPLRLLPNKTYAILK